VLQSLFVKLLQSGLPPDLHQNPARYLHRAAVNLSLNVIRSRNASGSWTVSRTWGFPCSTGATPTGSTRTSTNC
jgi:hypothetical protein